MAVEALVDMLALVVLGLRPMGLRVPLGLAGVVEPVLLAFKFLTTLLQAMSMCFLAEAVVALASLGKGLMAPLALYLSIEAAVVVAALLAQAGQLLLAMKEGTLGHMAVVAAVACIPL